MNFLSLTDFKRAEALIRPHIHRTPILTSETLNQLTGYDVRLKAELYQKAGSYKVRGPLNVLANLSPAARARGLVCSSAGNHAQGVARAARLYNVPCVVVMSNAARPTKIEATKGYGATVILHGEVWDDANERALQIRDEEGLTYVHPFDDPRLVAGQGGVGLEFIEDAPELDAVLVPIGGGGLISGCAMAIKALKPDVKIIGVEAAGSAGMRESMSAGRVVTLKSTGPMIDGLVVRRVGEYNFHVVKHFVDEIIVVDEKLIFDTVVWAMERLKVVVEGAAAAPIAALLYNELQIPHRSIVGCILSGGNLDLSELKSRSLN